MNQEIHVLFLKDGDAWVAQGLEHDICVQASTPEELYGRFEVAVDLEKDESGQLGHIPKAPDHFFRLWETRAGDISPVRERDASLRFGLAA